MRIVTYKLNNSAADYRMGFMRGDKVVDLGKATEYMQAQLKQPERTFICPADPVSFYQGGLLNFELAKKVEQFYQAKHLNEYSFSRHDVKLGPPVTRPEKIICIGTNYRDHVKEMKSEVPQHPVLFAKFINALIGPDDEIVKSKKTTKLDYEVELVIVMGAQATDVAETDALNYIAGYTIGNDISARDLQKRTPQWLQGKSLDRSTPIGPWLVTADELVDPGHLKLTSKVNGYERQSGNTNQLIFNIPYLISFISSLMTLEPGDIILTGTPDGVGFAQNPPTFLQVGDEVELEIEGIGLLKNKIIE
ncbi:acylpyruvate hydrolase [Amphibacillus marinus]|uniref:Acylpyruvate hydrolase n=1 Tax=Amphibacillus marinus TaxID=872970 RepID=A0A1H8MGI8_9BACI|nr:fumarylacetoacetate hydrolase family protein [Amphibacillus marinus]SEO16384.1 acylpyruvate hydrolase [Amphibacillus marinus]